LGADKVGIGPLDPAKPMPIEVDWTSMVKGTDGIESSLEGSWITVVATTVLAVLSMELSVD